MRYIFVAGTFNVFHDGHRRILDRAIEEQRRNGGVVVVGITTNRYAETYKDVPVNDYADRCEAVREYMAYGQAIPHLILQINGPRIPPEFPTSRDDVLICASDTKDSAMDALEAIPEERRPRMVVIWRDPAMPSSSDIIRSMSKGNE